MRSAVPDWTPEAEQEFMGRVERLVAQEIGPRANEVGRSETFAWESFRALAREGVFATSFPVRYGGTEAPLRLRVRIIEAVARVCSAAASMVTGVDLSGRPIAFAAAPTLAATVMPKLASGELQSAFALTEPGAGSDVAGMSCTARPEGDAWVLNGVKRFISRATVADLFIVVARTEGTVGAKGLSAFLVDRDAAGLRVGPVQPKLGWIGIPIAEVFLDEVRVPADRMLGAEGEGFAIAQDTLVRARIGHAAMAVGRAQGAIDIAAQYAARRSTFGRRLGDHQGVQWMLAEMTTQVEAARCLVHRCAQRYDDADPQTPIYASMAKLHAADLGMRVTTDCLQLLGGNGYLQQMPLERFMRDAKLNQIGEGASEIHKTVIGRHVIRQAGSLAHPCLDLDGVDL